mmetsp:Transcript_51572/g.129567  ORF Transcript_51572/g.129567 Transcript_51572/m.129567 type:complete len:341 (-) Transcript_51572:50-1072(-)
MSLCALMSASRVCIRSVWSLARTDSTMAWLMSALCCLCRASLAAPFTCSSWTFASTASRLAPRNSLFLAISLSSVASFSCCAFCSSRLSNIFFCAATTACSWRSCSRIRSLSLSALSSVLRWVASCRASALTRERLWAFWRICSALSCFSRTLASRLSLTSSSSLAFMRAKRSLNSTRDIWSRRPWSDAAVGSNGFVCTTETLSMARILRMTSLRCSRSRCSSFCFRSHSSLLSLLARSASLALAAATFLSAMRGLSLCSWIDLATDWRACRTELRNLSRLMASILDCSRILAAPSSFIRRWFSAASMAFSRERCISTFLCSMRVLRASASLARDSACHL